MAEPDGFDPGRLARLESVLQGYCDRGEIPGAVALLQRHDAPARCIRVGHGDDAATMPIDRDTLVRIGSMTKPIVSVAALTLVEEGRLRLGDPVAQWLPELSSPRVLRHVEARLDDTVVPVRGITVEDLLTHRPGFATALVAQGPLGQAVQPLSGGLGQRSAMAPDDWLALLASLPLAAQPGEAVINGFATDVLGILLSRLTGQALPDLLADRVLGPLGMHDTAFFVPQEKRDRFVPAYTVGWLSKRRKMTDPAQDSRFAQPPLFPSGSGGMVSSADDYLRFGRMLRDGGVLDGHRILSRKTIDFMTVDFLTPEQRRMPFFGADYWADRGLGLGVYVLDSLARHGMPASIGQYGWSGAFATQWFNDPAESMTAVLMTQVAFPAVKPPLRNDFEMMVYQAIAD